jgi:peroxiredoxin
VASHQAFRDKYGLTVPLLADPQLLAARAYEVAGEHGVKRQTYVVDEQGRIAQHWRKVPDTNVHAAEVLARLTT